MSATLYCSDGINGGSGSKLWTLDPATADPTVVGFTGYHGLNVLCFDRTDDNPRGFDTPPVLYGVAYVSNANKLSVFNPETGSVVGGAIGPIWTVDEESVIANNLACSPDGVLYTWDGNLYSIDKTTAVATLVGGPSDFVDSFGLAYDPEGNLWLLGDGDVNAGGSLRKIDPATGTVLATTALTGYDRGASGGFQGASCNPDTGVIHALNYTTGGGGLPDLVTIDPDTAVVAFIGTPSSDFGTGMSALAWMPTPSSPTPEDPQGICIAFENQALDEDPTWTRLDDPNGYRLISGWSTKRGKDETLDKSAAGTATLRGRDLDGTLDPTNTDGPFYGELTSQKPVLIRIQHPFTLEWHTIFRGFVDKYNHDLDMWTEERGIDHFEIEVYDGFGYMSRVELMPTVHGHSVSILDFPSIYYKGTPSNLSGEPAVFVHVDDRIVKILDDLGWPNPGEKRAGLRDVYSGNVSVQGSVVDRGDGAMAALGDAVDAELPGKANHYMSKDGVYRFRGRFAFLFPENPGYGINFWSAGSVTQARLDPTVAAIAGLKFSDQDLINSCGAWPQGVSDADVPSNLVEDAASVDEFGRSGASFPDLITSAGHDDDGNPTTAVEETHKFADFYVGNQKDPRTIVTALSFVGRTDDVLGPAIWDLMCGVEIGDVISLETSHAGGGGFNEEYLVDNIAYDNEVGQLLRMDLAVSPRPTYNPFGEVDTALS